MRRLALVFLVAGVLGAPACSAGAATGHVATMDAAAQRACADLRQLAQDRPGLSPRELRDRVEQVYDDAKGSANPVIQARAVALYTDATYLAEGAGPGTSIRKDLAAMEDACRASSR